MNTFNLDKFASKRTVTWKDVEYTITGLTLEDEINDNISERITEAKTSKDRLIALRDFITKSSTFPVDTVNKMTEEVLIALFKIARGMDPDEKASDTEGNASKE